MTDEIRKQAESEAQEVLKHFQANNEAYVRHGDRDDIYLSYASAIEKHLRRIAELEEWKKQASKVINDCNLQECAKELNIKLGESIAPKILTKIIEFKMRILELEERNLEDNTDKFDAVKTRIEDYIDTNAFITKRFDENYEAYKALKKQLEEKNELLEKIRPLLDQGSIVHNTGMMLRFRQDCREALELLNKTMPKKDA